MTVFKKFMISSKFQVAVLAIGLIYLSMEIFYADPAVAIKAIRDVAIAYFGARVLEPIVEFVTKKFSKPKVEKQIELDLPIR